MSVGQSITSSERLIISSKTTSNVKGTIYYLVGANHFAAGTSNYVVRTRNY